MAAENGLTDEQDREHRMARDLDELVLAVENCSIDQLREWMADQGYLLPTERNEMIQRNNNQLLELTQLRQGRGTYPLQTS